MGWESHLKLVRFLQEDLAVSPEAIALAQRQGERVLGSLPMVLWQYGLLSLDQLEQTWDWLAAQSGGTVFSQG